MNDTTTPSRLRMIRGVLHQYGYRLVLGELPRLYYGNDAGFQENYGAWKELRALQARAPVAPGPDRESASLRREGFLALGKPYPPSLVESIRNKFEALIRSDASLPIGPRVKEAIRGIVDPLEHIPELEQLLSPAIRTILQGYYRTHFKVEHVRLWRNVHVEGPAAHQDVFSNLWHNDHDPVTLLRLFVYMTDGVTRDTGATRFHGIPATKQIMRRGYMRRRAILPPARRILEDESRMLFFEGDAGSACLLNPQLCLHRAGVPGPGSHRDMIQFTLAPSDRPLPEHWAAAMPPDPVMRAYAEAARGSRIR